MNRLMGVLRRGRQERWMNEGSQEGVVVVAVR
jgi:hypothetical protein